MPALIVGAVGLGLINIGYLAPGASGAAISVMVVASSIGLLLATIWAVVQRHNAAASLFGVFFGFYGSYAALWLGLHHGWFGIAPRELAHATETWLICWFVAIMLMTLTTLRLPCSFTLLLGLVDVALVLEFEGTSLGTTMWTRAAGAVVFLFVAVAAYLFVDVMDAETGGSGLPLGRSILGG